MAEFSWKDMLQYNNSFGEFTIGSMIELVEWVLITEADIEFISFRCIIYWLGNLLS